MSVISSNDLLSLPVVTQSGHHLGSLRHFDVDVETHAILRYYVKPSGFVNLLSGGELCIAASLVVSIARERMVVRDAVESEEERARAARASPTKENPIPVLTRK